ncbi:TolC family protein [Parvicella tangerina]|uniref:TolC family protein n=1 Tax=Parvicella tangerina TaxID=2829795 RepID=A0A916NAA0_9FLAO|nr:TolC family protein [Parvicella tangerina]CAG5078774.1 hypothetical protein CRYO30217_00763 [Parvicella tangerina]
MKKIGLILMLWLQWLPLFLFAQPESGEVMSYEQFIGVVKQHHPVMIQANEIYNSAEGALLESRGGFDPVLKGDLQQKEYEGTRYFQLSEAGLVVPTWIGANIKLGYTQSIGDYINVMDKLPSNGLVFAGVELPLGQGLFYDKRRAAVDKAKLYVAMAGAERSLLVNDVIYQASMDYWEWFEKHHQVLAVDNLLKKSAERLKNIKRSAELGDKPYVDTLEASIQFQNFQSLYMDLKMAEENARAYVNIHLWADGILPLELDTSSIPEQLNRATLDMSVWQMANDTLIANHPKLNTKQFKIDINEVELRLAREYLKPKLNINYNVLNEPVGGDLVGFNPNDYKFGVGVAVPLFLRSSRGQIQKQKAELQIAKADYEWTREQLRAKLVATVNKSKNSVAQAQLLSEVVVNYRNLVNAERKLFEIGESSLMMLNYREIALLESEIKWIEKISKSKVAEIQILYAIGQLN